MIPRGRSPPSTYERSAYRTCGSSTTLVLPSFQRFFSEYRTRPSGTRPRLLWSKIVHAFGCS
jgi:hypothetical protein